MRLARHLLHAGEVARTGLVCSKATALIALAALEAVMGDPLYLASVIVGHPRPLNLTSDNAACYPTPAG
jgi:hypothetical protein